MGSTCSPSTITIKLASSPSRKPHDNPRAGVTELVIGERVVDGRLGFICVIATITPFPRQGRRP